MSVSSSTYLAKLLERTELFSGQQLQSILNSIGKAPYSGITSLVVGNGYATEEQFLDRLAKAMDIRFVKLGSVRIEKEILEKLPTKVVFQYNVVPISSENGVLVVTSSDPLNPVLMDALRLASGARVRLVLSTSADIAKAIKTLYGVGADTVDKMIGDRRYDVEPEEDIKKLNLDALDQEALIVRFVNQIIWEAFQQGATDIHLEPMEEQLRIRYRIDGVLHETPVPPNLNRFQAAIISRIKVMASMDIAEKRLPMDGRIGLRIKGDELDIRVSTMPTVYGESVSLRLLQSKGKIISLAELGMSDCDAKLIREIIHHPNGIVLVTGPTGSGKSTSLYAYLQEINTTDLRILTAENPIEYEIPGVNQVLVRPEIGLTFARALRSFLRQDPDIIMVGEIRDLETAEIAIQASLTGHLVFSTLHTNDAAGSFTRLLDMGVEPYLVASSVEAVVAQRLVRKLCPSCKRKITPDPDVLRDAGFKWDERFKDSIAGRGGCEQCGMTGFRGRIGVFEVLQVSERIRAMVIARNSTDEIKQVSMSEGMSTLRDDGWQKIVRGITTVEEVLRVTEENE